jgi:translation elongation factor EF-Ts
MIAKESGYKTADKTADRTATEGQTTVQTTVEMTATGAMGAMQVLPVNPAISS